MAEVSKDLELKIQRMPGVQVAMRKYVFEIEAMADANLEAARSESVAIGRRINNDARVESSQRDRVTWVVELIDEGHNHGLTGTGAAGNIEQGRLAYIWRTNSNGRFAGETYGGMVGLFILRDAVRAVRNRHRRELR